VGFSVEIFVRGEEDAGLLSPVSRWPIKKFLGVYEIHFLAIHPGDKRRKSLFINFHAPLTQCVNSSTLPVCTGVSAKRIYMMPTLPYQRSPTARSYGHML